jgi:hypothetical protein
VETILQIATELIGILSGKDLTTELSSAIPVAEQLLALLGDKNAQRDLQAKGAFDAAMAGSVTAAQYLYHNSQPDSGMPHEDIVDGQKYWNQLVTAGWTVSTTGTVVPPAA